MRLPAFVEKLGYVANAWLVGSALTTETPNDYDVVVPLENWPKAAALIPAGAVTNSHGGIRVAVGGVKVDVWADDVAMLLTNRLTSEAMHIRSGARIKSA